MGSPPCRTLSLVPLSEIQGPFFIFLTVEDDQSNIDQDLVIVTITDEINPNVSLSYFITPGLNRRINFLIISDGSVENFNSIPNTFYLGDSTLSSLPFSPIDIQTDLQVWSAPYRFTESGSYSLLVNLTDASGNTAIDSLSLSVALPVSEGGVLKSPSGKMLVEYPGIDYSGDQMLLFKEEGLPSAEFYIDTLARLYSIQSSIPDDIALIANFTGETDGSDFYTFYRVIDGQTVPIPTFIDKNGIFQASISLNTEFYFGPSSKSAQNTIIPQDHLYCYPNPFNSVISIMFFIPRLESVNISIYNILGHLVFSDAMIVPPGLATITWDGRDENGKNLPTGLYFYHLSTVNKQMTTKITILK